MEKIKAFQVRLPKSVWLFLKDQSARQERSMNDLIFICIEKYKKRVESRLTQDDSVVS